MDKKEHGISIQHLARFLRIILRSPILYKDYPSIDTMDKKEHGDNPYKGWAILELFLEIWPGVELKYHALSCPLYQC
jgi:hypothetical protein